MKRDQMLDPTRSVSKLVKSNLEHSEELGEVALSWGSLNCGPHLVSHLL